MSPSSQPEIFSTLINPTQLKPLADYLSSSLIPSIVAPLSVSTLPFSLLSPGFCTTRNPIQSLGTILYAERWCCRSSLLGYWAQSWMGHHSDTGYSNGSINPASWHSFCWPRKDDRRSQPHLVLFQRLSVILTQDLRIPSHHPSH